MDDHTTSSTEASTFRNRHSFLIFIVVSIIVAFSIVVISMELYNGSGAAQLDLSRPGYKSVQSQATGSDGDFQTFSSNGKINNDVIRDFQTLYTKESQKIKSVNAFGGDPLSPVALGMDSQTPAVTN